MWVRLDDGFTRHPRMVAAGKDGRSLFIAGLCYCGTHLTDGRIPKAAFPMLCAEAGVPAKTPKVLIEVGSWIDKDDHIEVHDFLVYNPSRAKVLADRAAASERQRKARESRRDKQRDASVTDDVTSRATTRPDPTPTAEEPTSVEQSFALVSVESSPSATSDVEIVFNAWKESTGKSRARLDAKRRRVITSALKQYPLEDCLDAVRGWRHSPHNRGENEQATVYNSLDLLLRDAERIERFRDLERHGPPKVVPQGMSGIVAFAARHQ